MRLVLDVVKCILNAASQIISINKRQADLSIHTSQNSGPPRSHANLGDVWPF